MEDGYVAVACMSLAAGRIPPELAGAWLVWYDPEGNDGTGDAAWSHDPADAARFTPEEWVGLYTTAPANRPVRPDGKPNRPITMFTLMIVPVDPGKLPSILPEVNGSPPMTDAEFMAHLAALTEARTARREPQASPPPPRIETEAEFTARLDRMVAEAEAGKAPGELRESRPEPERPPSPPKQAAELDEPGALSESLRKMGLM
jgi:hypothetical protein